MNKREIFDLQYKIYRDKTLINAHIKIQLLLDKIKIQELYLFVQCFYVSFIKFNKKPKIPVLALIILVGNSLSCLE